MTDWIGRWFDLMEDPPERIRIALGRSAPGSAAEPAWVFYPHQECDGIGAFAHLVRTEGRDPGTLPQASETVPSRPILWYCFARHLWIGRRRTAIWRNAIDGRAEPPAAIAWAAYSRETTSMLRKALRARATRMTAALAWSLNQVLPREWFSDPSANRVWLVPTNLRGAVRYPIDTANHASYLLFVLNDRTSCAHAEQRMRFLLRKRVHWGPWLFLVWGEKHGFGSMRRVSEKYRSDPYRRAGVVSNLGVWNESGASGIDDRRFFCPPPVASYPVAAGAVTWNAQLTVSLQLHASLAHRLESASEILKRWTEVLGGQLSVDAAPDIGLSFPRTSASARSKP